MRTICLAILLSLSSLVPAFGEPSIVVDVRTGAVLSHHEAFDRWYPASITKLMTTYLAFEDVRAGKLSMKSPVRMTRNASRNPPSKMGYKPGTILTLENALKILMVKSANDVAVAIGEAVEGSEPAFVKRMNKTAKRLGMIGTHFANPHGLPDDNQYTTARDFAILAVTIRREFSEYNGLFAIEALKIGKKILRNYNILLGRFPGAVGMKTGYICASGFNLVAAATRNGRTLVAVVLGAKSQQERAEIAAEILTKGFETSENQLPLLADLRPYGTLDEVHNIRNQICTKKAQAKRYDGRDVDGHLVFRSPYLTPMNRAPIAVGVRTGGATGPAAANTHFADIPLPTPRPHIPSDTQQAAQLKQNENEIEQQHASNDTLKSATAPPQGEVVEGLRIQLPLPTMRPKP